MKLISDRMEQALTGLYGMCFTGNSICDNILTQLDVDFVMPNTSNIVHYYIAHVLTELADEVGEYAAQRGVSLKRPMVDKNMDVFSNTKDMFKTILDFMLNMETEIYSVSLLAKQEKDGQTNKFLNDFLKEFLSLTKLSMDLYDFVDKNGDTKERNMFMDSVVNRFLSLKKVK